MTFYPDAPDNSDSTLFIDTCGLWELDPTVYLDSGKYLGLPSLKAGVFYKQTKRYYSKSVWGLEFFSMPGIQVFDTLGKDLNSLEYFTVEDIDTSYKEIYNGFQQTKEKYGEIIIRLLPSRNMSIKEQLDEMGNFLFKSLYLETENIVNSEEFAEFLGNTTNHPCTFESGLIYLVFFKETSNKDYKISYNRENLHIESIEEIHNLTIYSITGIKLKDLSKANFGKLELNVDISTLPNGFYFIIVNNSFDKFSIAR